VRISQAPSQLGSLDVSILSSTTVAAVMMPTRCAFAALVEGGDMADGLFVVGGPCGHKMTSLHAGCIEVAGVNTRLGFIESNSVCDPFAPCLPLVHVSATTTCISQTL
jgi:hypothetical protein